MAEPSRKSNKPVAATEIDIRTVRSHLLDRVLIYFAIVVPLGLGLSLLRILEHGWHPVYTLHVAVTALLAATATFRKRLSYHLRAMILLGVFLSLGIVGLCAFGLLGGGHLVLITFAVLAAVTLGTRAGLIACTIAAAITLLTGLAVTAGLIRYTFDVATYATSLSAWGIMLILFFLFIPIAVIALGTVHEHLAASLRNLQESHAKHRRLVGSLTDAILYRYDTGGFLTYVSPSIKHVLGYSIRETSPHYSRFLSDHPDNQDALQHAEQSIRGIRQPPYELQMRAKNGDLHWMEVSETPVIDQDGRVVAVEGVAYDITARKRAAEEREDLIGRLEAQNAELERFAYTVSHDLKSPLITIKGYLGALHEDLIQGEVDDVAEDVNRISGAADKMGALLDDLLEMSRVGRVTNPPELIPLGELVADTVQLVQGQLDRCGARVEVEPDLPEVFGDRVRLSELLQNLIDNAVKYARRDTPPHIEIGARRDENHIVCHVRDNGIGIEPSFHDRVFRLFDQLDPKAEGSGVGLAISRRIVEIHGGRIWVESTAGHGATFFFALPATSASD